MANEQVSVFRTGQSTIPTVVVDALVGESHTAENKVTELPIESGSPLTDHVIIQPDTVEISAEISNFDGIGKSLNGERAKTAWQQLKKLRNDRVLLDITTQHELYTNMVILSVTAEHVVPYTGRMSFVAKFQKVDVANLRSSSASESILAGNSDLPFLGGGDSVSKTGSDEINDGQVDTNTKEADERLFETLGRKILEGIKEGIDIADETLEAVEDAMEVIELTSAGARKIFSLFNDDERLYGFKTFYNYSIGEWFLDIFDGEDNPVISGRALIPGDNALQGFKTLSSEIGNIQCVARNQPLDKSEALGSDAQSDLIVTVFPPGVYEQLEEELVGNDPKDLLFDIDELGYTIA